MILDEPFSGLDPVNQGLLEDEILRAAKGGAAVVFSTHVMQHAERLCDRILLLRKGSKRFEGTIDKARDQRPATIDAVARDGIGSVPGVMAARSKVDLGGGWHERALGLAPGACAEDVLEACTAQGVALRRFEERRATLHDVFVHLVGADPAAPAESKEAA